MSKKILIIRFSSIGDIVLTSPVIRVLKKQLGAEIHFLTKVAYRSVLIANPYIDQLHVIQKNGGEVLPELQAIGFDYIIDLHKNIRSRRLRSQLGGKHFTFNKINWEKWLLVNVKINRLPEVHIVDRYLGAVAALGVVNDHKGLDYFIPSEEEIDASLFEEWGYAPFALNEAIAFVIGAAHATKRMPADRIQAICSQLEAPILLLGGPGEAEVGKAIAEQAGAHVINTCGKLRLNQSASVVRQVGKVISHDTGMMHIAAAFRKDIISVWGNTVPEFGMYPYLPGEGGHNQTFEVKGLSCRPCSKIGYDACPKGHFKCMQHSVEEIARVLNEKAI